MASRELSILVTAKNMASRVLGTVRGDINSLDDAGRRAGSNLGRNLAAGGAVVAGAIAVNVRAGVDSLIELERVNNLTAAALESTGDMAGQSVKGIRDRSEALEATTGVDDKVIQNAQNLLLTFRDVRDEAFGETLDAAIDLNAVLGGNDESLQGVLMLVGRAVNDPIRGLTALTRRGITFTDQQRDEIKVLQESGDLLGAQALILEELNKQTEGAAEASFTGPARAQKLLADSIEDAQMALATGFLPLIERVSAKLTDLMSDPKFLPMVTEFGEMIAAGFDSALDFAESVPWDSVGSAFGLMGTGAKAALDMFMGAPPWLQTAVLTGWGLNKLTGGALSTIVGALGSGLVKGVLGMNAGVVNINAGSVNGGVPGAGPAGRGKGPAGILIGLTGVGIAAMLADEFEEEIDGLAEDIHDSLNIPALPGPNDWQWPLGSKNPPMWLPDFLGGRVKAAAGMGKGPNVFGGGSAAGGGGASGSFPLISALDRLTSAIRLGGTDGKMYNRAGGKLGGGGLFVESVRLDTSQVTDLREPTRKAHEQLVRMTADAKSADTANRTSNAFQTGEIRKGVWEAANNRIQTQARLIHLAMLNQGQIAQLMGANSRLERIAQKNWNVSVPKTEVHVSNNISVNEWQRVATSTVRAASPLGGGYRTGPI